MATDPGRPRKTWCSQIRTDVGMSPRNYWDTLFTVATVEWRNGPQGLRDDDDVKIRGWVFQMTELKIKLHLWPSHRKGYTFDGRPIRGRWERSYGKNRKKLENVAIVNALQLEAARRRASRSALFLANFVLHMCTHCYFTACHQNSDIAIRFSDWVDSCPLQFKRINHGRSQKR